MGEENPLIYLLGGGSLTLLIAAFTKGAWDYFRGRHDREREAAKDRRDTISTLKDELREAEGQARDSHSEMVRHRSMAGLYWEYANSLRQLILCKYQGRVDELPPWPRND